MHDGLDCRSGGEPHVIYGRADASWRSVSIELPDGENVVSWTFDKVKDAYNASSGEAGYVLVVGEAVRK